MCGVIGYRPLEDHNQAGAADAFARLLTESRIRGMHCYGLARPGFVLRSTNLVEVCESFDSRFPTIAHARYSTSGDWQVMSNNQPIVVGNHALAFNGVIDMGAKEEFEARWGVKCVSDNDGEIFLQLLHYYNPASDTEVDDFAENFLKKLSGSFAGCWLIGDTLWAGRNERRPLWRNRHLGGLWYASTRDIFIRAEFPDHNLEEVPVGVELV